MLRATNWRVEEALTTTRGLRISRVTLAKIGLLTVVGAIALFQYRAIESEGAERARQLEVELSEIQPPAGVDLVQTVQSVKPNQVAISREYRGSVSFDQVRDYYGQQLEPRGWTFARDVTGTGSLYRCWTRADEQMSLESSLIIGRSGNSYVITISSGLTTCQ